MAYEDLIPGKEYTLKATLMDKATGEPLSVDDEHVTAELRFTPNSQSGTVDIELGSFDASKLDGHDLVVFEELYKQTTDENGDTTDVLVAEHKDINDENQTVSVTSSPAGSFFGKTGGSTTPIVIAIVVLLAAAGGCACYSIKHRAKKASDGTSDNTSDDKVKEEDGKDA